MNTFIAATALYYKTQDALRRANSKLAAPNYKMHFMGRVVAGL